MITPTPPPARQPTETPRICPVCNNDGFWVDVQPNRHTGDAEQVQVECELCSLRAQNAGLRAQLEEAKGELECLTKMYGERTAAFASVEDMLGRLPSETVWDAIRRLRAAPAAKLKAASRPVESPTPKKVPTGEAMRAAVAKALVEHINAISTDGLPDKKWEELEADESAMMLAAADRIMSAIAPYFSAPPAAVSAAQGDAP